MSQVSPFFEVQAPGGGFAQAEADLEHAFGKAAAWAAGPVKLERAGSHLVIKVIMTRMHSWVCPMCILLQRHVYLQQGGCQK